MKRFEQPDIKRYPLVIKDQVTNKLDSYKEGSGDLLPEDEFTQS